MDILLVEVSVKPERLNDFLDLIKYDAEHSENDEPGCLRFDVLQDSEDQHKFYYYERAFSFLAPARFTPSGQEGVFQIADDADKKRRAGLVRDDIDEGAIEVDLNELGLLGRP